MKYIEERIVKILMFGSIGIVGFFVLSVLYTIFRRKNAQHEEAHNAYRAEHQDFHDFFFQVFHN